MSKIEIILTIPALIVCWIFMVRYSMPMLLEWLEAMNTDETSAREGDKND